eukprot:2988792-Rhodomonas_salina.1
MRDSAGESSYYFKDAFAPSFLAVTQFDVANFPNVSGYLRADGGDVVAVTVGEVCTYRYPPLSENLPVIRACCSVLALKLTQFFAAVLRARCSSHLVHRFRVRNGQLLGSLIGIGNVDANITLVPIEITEDMRKETDALPFCEAVDDCEYS